MSNIGLHQFFKDNVARINYELEDALKIFNSKWQDVIDWSCLFFEEYIETKNWTIEMLLYVSDHTKKRRKKKKNKKNVGRVGCPPPKLPSRTYDPGAVFMTAG